MHEIVTPKKGSSYLAPYEQCTGVILPIWTDQYFDTVTTNKHHAHFYKLIFEAGPLDLKAVRFTRLQNVPKSAHKKYHEAVEGAELPDRPFITTILNLAGYVPAHAIDFSLAQPEVRLITPLMRDVLRRPGLFTVERSEVKKALVGQFLMQHAIWQEFESKETDEFLELSQIDVPTEEIMERKLRLGLRLAGKAIEAAVDPVNQFYREARDEGMLSEEAPVCAWQVMKNFVNGHETDYFDTLSERLMLAQAA